MIFKKRNIKKKITEMVILVDKKNRKVGVEEKMKAHYDGLLHRAFSIFVFNSEDKLLLQRRAEEKYHSPGLWSNTVCSHPRQGERTIQAAHRRLNEELGFNCNLKKSFSFIYKAKFDNGLIENEHDTVIIGYYEGKINPNPSEVMDYKWIKMGDLKRGIKKNPDLYTKWLKIALKTKKLHCN